MKKTTAPPSRNVVEVLPELAARASTTVRLHPRRDSSTALDRSKIGGMILWPASESWPECDESGEPDCLRANESAAWAGPQGKHGALAPLLQLRHEDFPAVEFRGGTDLLQLLWCPFDHPMPTLCQKIFAFWRKASIVDDPLPTPPAPIHASDEPLHECVVYPERVVEYPCSSELSTDQRERLEAWDFPLKSGDEFDEALVADATVDLYDRQLSACPSSKVGGHVAWIQYPEVPRCDRYHPMTHLLTLSDFESSSDINHRWLALEDREFVLDQDVCEEDAAEAIINPLGFHAGGGSIYVFICRQCDDWPVRTVFQR